MDQKNPEITGIPKNQQRLMADDYARAKIKEKGWFTAPGAYVLIDGQFGSTGKGLAEQKLAILAAERVNLVTSNAGPNSGHTIYDQHGRKIVTKQVPSFNIQAELQGTPIPLHLNSGSQIDPRILAEELEHIQHTPLTIHPHATAILPRHYQPQASLDKIASTQKGTGPALADKILRKRFGVVENVHDFEGFSLVARPKIPTQGVVFVSTAQGFSLGLNSGFYPHTTCRECSVQQALSDARIPARRLQKVIMTLRTFPIRVGDTPLGSSGGWYSDQRELGWEAIGQPVETTTVTGRPRRIASWSDQQFHEACLINEPDALFLNFMNYLKTERAQLDFVGMVTRAFLHSRNKKQPDFIMLGYGPNAGDIDICFDLADAESSIARRAKAAVQRLEATV